YSEETNRIIDVEVSKLIEEQYVRAKQILEESKDKLILLAEKLLEKEVIFQEDLIAIFGERPWNKLTPAEKIQKIEDEREHKNEPVQEEEKINPLDEIYLKKTEESQKTDDKKPEEEKESGEENKA
ncbi:MAG TPA: hypothetical protein VKX31_08435, partial [Brumimicrobium sp.]|nr:hypothetical protein [Brumimicrobium sp.]